MFWGMYSEHFKKLADYKKISNAKMGHIVTPESRQKIGISRKGKPLSEEHRKKISSSNIGRHTHSHSLETRKKLSVLNSGEKNPKFGKPLSEETRLKISISRIGKPFSAETCKRLSESHMGLGVREKNSNWKGGKTPLLKEIRVSKKMKIWKNDVFSRDNYKDVYTQMGGELEAHHIIPFSKLIHMYDIKSYESAIKCKELWDINNGVTLLKTNHRKYHSILNGVRYAV